MLSQGAVKLQVSTCVLAVMSSRAWSFMLSNTSVGSFSQGSIRPGPSVWRERTVTNRTTLQPSSVVFAASLWSKNSSHNKVIYYGCANLWPGSRMPVEMHSRTRRMASPGLSGPEALLITFSTSSSIAWQEKGEQTLAYVCTVFLKPPNLNLFMFGWNFHSYYSCNDDIHFNL